MSTTTTRPPVSLAKKVNLAKRYYRYGVVWAPLDADPEARGRCRETWVYSTSRAAAARRVTTDLGVRYVTYWMAYGDRGVATPPQGSVVYTTAAPTSQDVQQAARTYADLTADADRAWADERRARQMVEAAQQRLDVARDVLMDATKRADAVYDALDLADDANYATKQAADRI